MLLLIVPIIIQVLLIIHVIRTGRNQLWIWVLLFLPLAGGIAYLAVEIVPQLFRSRTAQRTARGLKKAMPRSCCATDATTRRSRSTAGRSAASTSTTRT
jgi:hypothetical protein